MLRHSKGRDAEILMTKTKHNLHSTTTARVQRCLSVSSDLFKKKTTSYALKMFSLLRFDNCFGFCMTVTNEFCVLMIS